MVDASRPSNGFVAAKDDERREAKLPGLLRIRETEFERVLAREKRDHQVPRQIAPEIRTQVSEVVFLLRADGTVGEKDWDGLTCESADAVICIDPGIDATACIEVCTRRPQFRGDDRGLAAQHVMKHARASE